MAQQILYIPGFGDHDDYQIKALKKWDSPNVQTNFIKIKWTEAETYEVKLTRILAKIDELVATHGKISLVGVSAGASLAMNAYCASKDKISGVAFICGKLRNGEGVGEKFFRENPDFRESIFSSQTNIRKLTYADKAKMLTLRSAYDGLIPAADSQIPGAKNQVLPFVIHIPTIFLALNVFKNQTISFLEAQAVK